MKNEQCENVYAVQPFDNDADEPAAFSPDDFSVGDSSVSSLRDKVVREIGISANLADEVLDLLSESGALICRHRAPKINGSEGQWRSLSAKLLRVIEYVSKHPTRLGLYAALHVWDIPVFDNFNGHLSQQDFAKTVIVKSVTLTRGKHKGRVVRQYLTKAAVNNAVLHAQHYFLLPPRSDQRAGETRKKQKQVRESKLL